MYIFYWSIFLAVCHEVVTVGITPKLDFSSDADVSRDGSNTSEASSGGDDVEVKHTIVVSTKLKHSAIAGTNTQDDVKFIRPSTRKQNSQRSKPDDSGEVPVIKGYLALETTQIRTPDTRTSPKPYPDSVLLNYNLERDGFNIYPRDAADPRHWKPSTFFNNIHWNSPEPDQLLTVNIPKYDSHANKRRKPMKSGIHRKYGQDELRDYHCCKCRELVYYSTTTPELYPWYETTTKVRLDGKLAKLD